MFIPVSTNNERAHIRKSNLNERRKVGHMHTSQVVADHVARSQKQVPNGAEHAPVTQTPDIDKQQKGVFKGVTADF